MGFSVFFLRFSNSVDPESAALIQTVYITLPRTGEYLKRKICPNVVLMMFFVSNCMLVHTVYQQRIALSWECVQLLFRPRLEDEVTLINWYSAL